MRLERIGQRVVVCAVAVAIIALGMWAMRASAESDTDRALRYWGTCARTAIDVSAERSPAASVDKLVDDALATCAEFEEQLHTALIDGGMPYEFVMQRIFALRNTVRPSLAEYARKAR